MTNASTNMMPIGIMCQLATIATYTYMTISAIASGMNATSRSQGPCGFRTAAIMRLNITRSSILHFGVS
ncbi:hypothetical protein ACFL2D_02560 [Patescibacteria group bacterium]